MRTVILGPTGSGIRTVNIAATGPTGLWETCGQTASGPTGRFKTVQPSASPDSRFKSIIIPGYTGGGGGGYVANLVGFNGATYFYNAALGLTPTNYVTACVFISIPSVPANPVVPFFDIFPAGNEWNFLITGSNLGEGGLRSFVGNTAASAYVEFNTDNGVQTVENPKPFAFDSNIHSILFCLDLSRAPPDRICACYYDDTFISMPPAADANTGAGAILLPFDADVGVPDTTANYDPVIIGKLGVLQIRPGLNIANIDGTIDVAHRRNFVTAANKPVNPATATTAYGGEKIIFDGTAAEWTAQAIAQGFTVTGTPTDAGTIT